MKTALNAEETRICELMGNNPHEVIETREKELASAQNSEGEVEDPERIARLMGLVR